MSRKNRDVPIFPLVWAEVDLDALRSNLKKIRQVAHASNAGILAVVKADAYGHGMEAVARVLKEEGVKFFGVANIDEAGTLRKICPKEKILVLGSFHPKQISAYVRERIIPTVSCIEDVRVLAKNTRQKFSIHVKIDTGMGRLGVWHEELGPLFGELKKCRLLEVEGIYTHFSNADKNEAFTQKQISLFNRALARIRKLGFSPKYLHAANSIGLMRFKNAHFNLVRPGIVLYGIGLKPILALKTRISFLKSVEKGRALSYGATYQTPRPTKIATLPIGYSHGYRLSFSNKAFVLVHGRRCPVVGRVTMDQTLVDVGGVPAVRCWDPVTLIGREGKASILAEDLAQIIDTIPYEIVCAIHSRIPRIYKGIRS